MDIVVKGRNVEVPEHYRVHVAEKLTRVERYDHKAIRFDVELFHERNPRQAKSCQRVEITGRCRSGVVRAEACGPDFYAALDTAMGKLENRLRRAADRRKVHHGRRQPTSVAEATAPLASVLAGGPGGAGDAEAAAEGSVAVRHSAMDEFDETAPEYELPAQRGESPENAAPEHAPPEHATGPGRIIRHKHHTSDPMTVDQALYEMELVGHDFYLFADAESGKPSVVYRRKGFHYGVIQLV